MGRVTSAWQRIGLLSEIFTANHCCKKDRVPLNHLITYVVQVIGKYIGIGTYLLVLNVQLVTNYNKIFDRLGFFYRMTEWLINLCV